MFSAFAKAFGQLRDPRLMRIVIRSALIAVVIYAGLIAVTAWSVTNTEIFRLGWLEAVADLGAGLAGLVVATLLFPGIVSGVMVLWQDDVAAAVESRHYPDLPPPRQGIGLETAVSSLRLLALTVLINLMLLPVYLVLFFLPPLNLALYYAVNGTLLGREYLEAVGLRHLPATTLREVRTGNRGTVWLAGALIAALLTVPGLNLLAPVVGTAAMVHIFQKLTRHA
jgi:CysZ protein